MDKTKALRERIEATAIELGASPSAVWKWRKRGIAAEWKLRLITLPGKPFSLDELERVSKPTTERNVEAAE